MKADWQNVPLGELLKKSDNWIELDPTEQYKEVTVRLWGKGVVLRRKVSGSEIASKKRLQVKAGQFILSRIDARNGAFGLIPPEFEGAVVSNDFPVFEVNQSKLLSDFLGWLSRTHDFVDFCLRASEGTTNRVRLKERKFLATEIMIPHLAEQQRIVAKIEQLAVKIEEIYKLKHSIEDNSQSMLLSSFADLTRDVKFLPMEEVAPITRRRVEVDFEGEYPELGIRSFGKGTFHKPTLTGLEVGNKKLYRIEPGDLIFNNVFAWEGAVAVVKPTDVGRFGSHRFITCVAKRGVATANFLCFYFLTPEGLDKLGKASPGGAGRNRTLGLKALSEIEVPIPDYQKQLWFDNLQFKVNNLKRLQAHTCSELGVLLPSILDKAFRGEL